MKHDDEGGDEDDGEGSDKCDIKLFKGFCFLTDGWMNEWMDICECTVTFATEK